VRTTSGTYPRSLVTNIFHNGQPSHGGNRTTSDDFNLTKRNLWSFAVKFCYWQPLTVKLQV